MRKICFFIMSGLPIPAVKGGAIETLLQILIDKNEVYHDFDITVLSAGDDKAEELSKKYKHTTFVYFQKTPLDRVYSMISRGIYRLCRVPLPHSVGCYQALRYLKRHQDFDLLVNETWKVYLSPLLAKVFPKERILTHIHRKGEEKKGDITRRIDKSIGYLISVSDFISNDWCTITGRSADKAFVLKNCCNTEAFQTKISEEEKRELKRALGIRDDAVVLIFAGRITAEKGVKELLYAIQRVPVDNLHLLIVGGAQDDSQTDYEKEIDTIVKKLTCPVTRLGYVDNAKMYQFYALADIATIPSVCPDAAPLTVIEAMTAGVPVLTTNMGGIPEYACDGAAIRVNADDCLVENLASNIQRLATDKALRNKMSNCAAKQALLFTPDHYYSDFCKIIQHVEDSDINI